MKLKVPFYKLTKQNDCGPVVLKMVLDYFKNSISLEKISKLEKQLDSGMVWTLGIAVAAKKAGHKVKFFSISNFANEEVDFYKKYANDKAKLTLEELKLEAKKEEVVFEEKDIPLEELLRYVTKDSIPIVLLNWYVIAGLRGFHGHFLPITGYDKQNVYVHNPGIAQAQAHLSIKRELFKKAWEAEGTDKDTVIVYRK
jgi:hypothetical protein